VTDSDPQTSPRRKRWELDREGWEALLGTLANDRDAAGQKYEELRRRLINLFAWEQCDTPDNLADEVLNRLARKALEGAVIPHPDRFAFGIARIVIQEQTRAHQKQEAAVRELHAGAREPGRDWGALDAMQSCMSGLPEDRRELIERYYTEDRATLARKLGISVNALRNRAMRIRDELFGCMSRKRDKS
jgi:DNA-directed RNA polymerase specialized sigma24 family protein